MLLSSKYCYVNIKECEQNETTESRRIKGDVI